VLDLKFLQHEVLALEEHSTHTFKVTRSNRTIGLNIADIRSVQFTSI